MRMYNNNFNDVNVQNDDAWLFQTKIGDYGFCFATNDGRISVARCIQPDQVVHDYGHYVMSDAEIALFGQHPKARVTDDIEPELQKIAKGFKELCIKILVESRVIWLRKDGIIINKIPIAKTFHKGKWQ